MQLSIVFGMTSSMFPITNLILIKHSVLFSFLAFLMGLGTAVDVYQQFYPTEESELVTTSAFPNEPRIFTILKCFSINLNGKRVGYF